MPEKLIAKLITILVIFILLVIFAMQNFQNESRILILFWELGPIPVSIIIFVSILLGALITVCGLLPHLVRMRRKIRLTQEKPEY